MAATMSLRPLSELEAQALTREIAQTLALAWDKVVEAYQRRVWEPLGYGSWDSYCRAELGSTRLRLPAEEREEAVRSLRSAGLSTRAIAAATGLSHRTAARKAAGVPNGTPGYIASPEASSEARLMPSSPSITGLDGKSYPDPRNSGRDADEPIDAELVDDEQPEPVTPVAPATVSNAKRRPLAEAAKDAGWEIRRAAERVARIVGDDRLPTNKQQVSSALRSHLLFVAEAVTAALGELSDHN
jgi:hypothetical protein